MQVGCGDDEFRKVERLRGIKCFPGSATNDKLYIYGWSKVDVDVSQLNLLHETKTSCCNRLVSRGPSEYG